MAKKMGRKVEAPNKGKQHMNTSIGNSSNTKIKNKQKRRRTKARYRGQGK